VRREGENVVIHADLPGVPRDSIKIECTSDGITLSGQRQETHTEGNREGGYYFSERTYGSFHRHIPLPEGAQTEQAKAAMRDGVLEITVPVSRDHKRRRIEIVG
jgi:HSP20 family molecular chaperone IbpA